MNNLEFISKPSCIPGILLCSEVITAKYPPSSPSSPHTRENPEFSDIFGKVDKLLNIEECLI